MRMNATNSNWHTYYCGFNATTGTNYTFFTCSTGIVDYRSSVKAGGRLGTGKISKLAQRADDMELEPKCYCEGEMAYMVVYSYDTGKLKKLLRYAKRIGFEIVDYLEIKGEKCPCYL